MSFQSQSLRRSANLVSSLNFSASNTSRMSASNNFLSDQITSPTIQNEAKPTLNQVTRTSSSPAAVMTTSNQISNNLTKQSANQFSNRSVETDDNQQKNSLRLGNYLLFEPQSINDTFGTAINKANNQTFYWKKFERRDYMKRMETYFIMQGSEKILGFREIIFDSANFGGANQFVYVIFDQFYGDLHSYMKEKKRLDETEARHIFRQCVEAVKDCHQNGIIVRDIKLKKFVFIDAERTRIALANPEDCLVLDEDAVDDLIKSQQGCPAYVSPEVLNTNQAKYSGKLSDSWSLGIVLFTLLLGRYPFHHQTITTMFAKIARGKYQIPPSCGLSQDAKILLRSLIRLKPSERLLPNEILACNWMKQNDTNLTQLQQNKFKNLNSAYQYLNQLSASSAHIGANNSNQSMYFHKPLGISRSSPGGMVQQTNSQAQNSMQALKPSVDTPSNSDDNDRMVPEFNGESEQAQSSSANNFNNKSINENCLI